MVKRLIMFLVVSILVFSFTQTPESAAKPSIKVLVDGKEIDTDQAPIIINGRTLIPLRAIFEALNAYVDYSQATKTVYASKGITTIKLKLGSKIAIVNNVNVELDVPAQVINGHTFVPVRFVSEALGEDIHYDSASKQVLITTKVDSATNIVARDISDNGDGRDLQVRFNKALDETRIIYYKIMVVKKGKVASFDLNKANNVSPVNYTIAFKTGNNMNQTLVASSRDTDGALIKEDVAYSVFILSVSNKLRATQNSLSNGSSPISLKSTSVPVATNVRAADVADYGDGRDLQVRFFKASDEKDIAHYRVMVVREKNAASFNVKAASAIPSSNYTVVSKTGNNMNITLSSAARDVAGTLIKSDIPYKVFVLSVKASTSRKGNSLSRADSITLTHRLNVAAVTNLRVNDVSDYGDGRDLEIGFTKLANESNLNQYRVMVVPSADANKFNLAEAKEVPISNYTVVFKRGSNIKQVLYANTNDVKGNDIQSGVAYKVFVLSVGDLTRGYGDRLSVVSSEIRLGINPGDIKVSYVTARDVADHRDGRDLQVSFTIPSNEHRVTEYRIMVVRSGDVRSFNLHAANNVSFGNYTAVWKTGSNQTVNLSFGARDASGKLIQNDVTYRVFILSVGDRANSYVNSLSRQSSSIKLTNNFTTVPATNVKVTDIADFEDARDLQVSFRKATNESNLSEYRIMVIKSAQASAFNVAVASSIPSSNYTSVVKTGSNITTILGSSAKDVHGEVIRNGVAYRVFVLSVSSGGNTDSNALSAASSAITLSKNLISSPAMNVSASDINDFGDGRDLLVSFIKAADESKVSQYRILVVKSALADGFNLAAANAVHSNNYTIQAKTGGNITTILSSTARDVQGDQIRGGVAYKVFVLSESSIGNAESNALSIPSSAITLSNPSVDAVANVSASDIANNGNGLDMQVSFTKAANEEPIAYYAIMVVPSANANSFNLAIANGVSPANYTTFFKTGSDLTTTLSSSSKDIKGGPIQNGTAYRVFVLSIADGTNATTNGLSSASNEIVLLEQ